MAPNLEATAELPAIAVENTSNATIEGGLTSELPHRPKPTEPEQDSTVTPAAASNDADDDDDDEVPEKKPSVEQMAQQMKKKKKRSKGGKNKNKPTGFEDYYVDAPITPAEYAEERKLYDPSNPAIRRLELAIQRYQAKRRINCDRMHIFAKYMSYGGVKVGPKMFGGNDQRDLQDMDAEDILTATAQSNIPEDRQDWVVDFELVAKGFFSSVFPEFFAIETEEFVGLGTMTIKNFLNYILHHSVVPEYESNILAARQVCDVAQKELWMAYQATVGSPGDFNMACSTLFGGQYFGFYVGDQDWMDGIIGAATGMPDDTARKVVKFALAGAGTYEQAVLFRDLANENKLEATCINEDGFEIVSITRATDDVKHFYRKHAKDLKPVGKVRARPWRNPGLADDDLPPGEAPSYLPTDGSVEYEFFIEESLLDWFFEGMKVDARVWSLNCGVHFFEKIYAMYCSFYTALPNESMMGWKKPRDLKDDELAFAEGEGGEGAAGGEGEGDEDGEGMNGEVKVQN